MRSCPFVGYCVVFLNKLLIRPTQKSLRFKTIYISRHVPADLVFSRSFSRGVRSLAQAHTRSHSQVPAPTGGPDLHFAKVRPLPARGGGAHKSANYKVLKSRAGRFYVSVYYPPGVHAGVAVGWGGAYRPAGAARGRATYLIYAPSAYNRAPSAVALDNKARGDEGTAACR